MKIGNIFKKEKKEKKEKPIEKKAETLVSAEKPAIAKDLKGDQFSFQVLKAPHITEKASNLNRFNQYVFKVFPDTNKIEIKRAVEKLYGVKVEGVKILVMPSKKRKLGRFEGEKSGFKKAIIKLAEGHKIDIVPK